MNPVSAHNSSELKATTPYSNVPTTSSSSQDLITAANQQQQQPRTSYTGTPTASSASSFTPLANVDTTAIGNRGSGSDFSEYFNHFNGLHTNINTSSSFSSSLMLDGDHYSNAARLPMSSGISVVPPGAPHMPTAYVNSSHFPTHGLTSKLPELQFPNAGTTGVGHPQSGLPPGSMEMAYSAPHMMGVLASSPHASIISPAYSPCSVTTQGSGGGAGPGNGNNKRSLGACGSVSIDADNKPGAFKARSKKESHNRIERRRRDYINSQISRLSSLLPPEMYHDVDGRRNKGTVLRLSVAYIMDLRNDLVQTTAIRQEANLARTLIPQLSSYIQSLENRLKEAEISSGKPLGSITGVLDDGLANYQSLLENWEVLARANAARPTNGESTPQGKIESEMASPLENMQMAFSAGRPPTTATTTTNNSSLSSYHPNAVFVGGPICKQEESDDMCYGSGHVPDDTTDGFFESTNTNNNNQNNGSTTNSVTKFDLSLMQQMTPSGQVDCGSHENPMQVECQNQ